jgi:hypothetical protein
MSIEEAFTAWPDKAVAANIPAYFCTLDKKAIWRYLDAFFSRLPSRNFMFQFSENLPLPEIRRVLPIVSEFLSQLQ